MVVIICHPLFLILEEACAHLHPVLILDTVNEEGSKFHAILSISTHQRMLCAWHNR